jgi:Flp pilus assembly secretin CpaC
MIPVLLAAILLVSCAAKGPAPVVQPAASEERAEVEHKIVAVGQLEVLEFPEHSRLIVDNAAILHVDKGFLPNSWRVIPLQKGSTILHVSDPRGRFIQRIHYRVLSNDMAERLQGVQRMLASVEGVRIDAMSDLIVVDGELSDPAGLERVQRVEAAFPGGLMNLATLSRSFYEEQAGLMEREIRELLGSTAVSVRLVRDEFVLHGEVDLPAELDQAGLIAESYLPKDGKYSIRNGIVLRSRPRSGL